jgi:hypothetical protein
MSAFGGKADMACCGNPLSRSLLGVKRTWPSAVQMSAYDPKRTFRAYYRRSIDLAKSHNAVAANNKAKLALTYCLNLWIARASQWIVDTTTAAKLSVVYE